MISYRQYSKFMNEYIVTDYGDLRRVAEGAGRALQLSPTPGGDRVVGSVTWVDGPVRVGVDDQR
jgi:hypothetical protein